MGVLGETLATGLTVDHAGKTIRFRLLTQDAKSDFESEFFEDARSREASKFRRVLARAGDDTTAQGKAQAEYQEAIDELKDDYLCGKFALLSNRGQKSIAEPEGMLRLCRVLTGETEATLIALISDKGKQMEIRNLISIVIAESFPGVEAVPSAQANGVSAEKKR